MNVFVKNFSIASNEQGGEVKKAKIASHVYEALDFQYKRAHEEIRNAAMEDMLVDFKNELESAKAGNRGQELIARVIALVNNVTGMLAPKGHHFYQGVDSVSAHRDINLLYKKSIAKDDLRMVYHSKVQRNLGTSYVGYFCLSFVSIITLRKQAVAGGRLAVGMYRQCPVLACTQ